MMTSEKFIEKGAAFRVIGQFHQTRHELCRLMTSSTALVEHESALVHFRSSTHRDNESEENNNRQSRF